jgi:hypothetical protein
MGFMLDPIDAQPVAEKGQLTYQQARDIEAGHKA